MSKEAMKLALEGAANYIDALGGDSRKYRQALANEALDKKAENARELGLDYEPEGGTQVSKVWWDGEKLMAKPIPLEDFYEPAQEKDQSVMYTHPSKPEPIPCGKPIGILMKLKGDEHMKLYPLAEQPAQRTWVGLTDEELEQCDAHETWRSMRNVEAKLKEKNT